MSGQASGSLHSIGYVAEAAYGTTPATPAFKPLRYTKSSLDLAKTIFQSAELRPDRQIAGITHGLVSVGGSVDTELSYQSHDDLLEAVLCGTWTAGVLKAGLLRRSFTIERHFADVGEYLRYTGCEIDTLDLKAGTGGIVTATYGFMGQAAAGDEAAIAGATYPAASTTSPMNSLAGTTAQEGGAAIAVVTEVSISLKNNMAARNVIGSNESLEPSIGRSDLTGSMTAYFETLALYEKFMNETISSLEFSTSDGINSYDFLVPKIKYTGGSIPVDSEGPILVTMPFQGLLDSVTGTNLQITRNPA